MQGRSNGRVCISSSNSELHRSLQTGDVWVATGMKDMIIQKHDPAMRRPLSDGTAGASLLPLNTKSDALIRGGRPANLSALAAHLDQDLGVQKARLRFFAAQSAIAFLQVAVSHKTLSALTAALRRARYATSRALIAAASLLIIRQPTPSA